MKRILVDNAIREAARQFQLKVSKKYGATVKQDLGNLKKRECIKNLQELVQYIDKIISNYETLLSLPITSNKLPSELDTGVPEIDEKLLKKRIIWHSIKKSKKQKRKITISEAILKCMRYEDVRDIYVDCISELNIRTCVYCNANYAVTRMEENVKKAQFEIDHFFPKSKYPHLCTSFFNFQPCCGCCNEYKGDSRARFNLYTSDANSVNPYGFQLMYKDLALYSINGEKKNLSVSFIEENDSIEDSIKTHDKMFHISGLYKESFIPEVIELVKKHEAFNKSARETFENAFPQLAMSIDEILYGTFINDENIHIRPLTKLLQDIHQQLNELYQEKLSQSCKCKKKICIFVAIYLLINWRV